MPEGSGLPFIDRGRKPETLEREVASAQAREARERAEQEKALEARRRARQKRGRSLLLFGSEQGVQQTSANLGGT